MKTNNKSVKEKEMLSGISARAYFIQAMPAIIRSAKEGAFGAPNDDELYTQCYYANRDRIKMSLERFLSDVDNHPVELVEWCENRWLEIHDELADKIEALGRPRGDRTTEEMEDEFLAVMRDFSKWLWWM